MTQIPSTVDADRDGLDDAREIALAARFAPVLFHDAAEPNWPVAVETILAAATLGVRDDGCTPSQQLLPGPVTAERLITEPYTSRCHGPLLPTMRDGQKRRTFFLADLPPELRAGEPDGRTWPTYVHVYPNDLGAITIQYWRAYAFNSGVASTILGQRVEFGFHGGDWEGIHVVLGRGDVPVSVRFLGHTAITTVPWAAAPKEGTHPLVASEPGGHASAPATRTTDAVRHETWPTGIVVWSSGLDQDSAGLIPLGEKLAPAKPWLRYAGLWGSPGFVSSGYWGPAFNETAMRADGFVTAWCEGTATPDRAERGDRECYAVGPP